MVCLVADRDVAMGGVFGLKYAVSSVDVAEDVDFRAFEFYGLGEIFISGVYLGVGWIGHIEDRIWWSVGDEDVQTFGDVAPMFFEFRSPMLMKCPVCRVEEWGDWVSPNA